MAKQPVRARRVSKGEILRQMDARARIPKVMEAAMNALDGGGSLIQVGLQHEYIDSKQAEHVEQHWHRQQAAAETLRRGFIQAARLALKRCKHVDSYWVQSEGPVRVAICESPQQITMLILAPVPAELERWLGGVQAEESDPEIEIIA